MIDIRNIGGPYYLRHLHWLCSAPSLVENAAVFTVGKWLPVDFEQNLQAVSGNARLAASLSEAAGKKLGHYFEQLYACLLTELLGWQILARNLPVRDGGRTLGELDFLVRNPATGEAEHHEVAVKFYLGCRPAGEGEVRWYGPGSRDRLDLKSHRLLEHQARLAVLPETQALLDALGLPHPVRSRVLMPGYLFYPHDDSLPAPVGVPADHQRGTWLRATAVEDSQLEFAVVLHKPDWLGPWSQSPSPDSRQAIAAAGQIAGGASPRLFARLLQDPATGLWREQERFFLVPDAWPFADNISRRRPWPDRD
ncbi:DUF1853 family protein [Kineobactrum salinum]|uniref:DUF1853 family protein n=1 Tax=Kineobactrum salinum TaxID=2708301 RepID=A0A6C0TXD1_9GAMM|nr:DUF1853 family protein [Kineobactrum salinum]QIB64288.1 DUF1853 family protein [Kineobactrum salinum]